MPTPMKNPVLLPSLPGSLSQAIPVGFSRIASTAEQTEWLERQALEVFAAMSNGGHSFRSALAAVFLSGMALAQAVQK
jgi:hypothetical protein